jgi:hypothetical protein
VAHGRRGLGAGCGRDVHRFLAAVRPPECRQGPAPAATKKDREWRLAATFNVDRDGFLLGS